MSYNYYDSDEKLIIHLIIIYIGYVGQNLKAHS